MVSLVIAFKGKTNAIPPNGRIDSRMELNKALQELLTDAASDGGENVLAAEILWTPSVPGETLDEKDMLMDYPELIRV